MAKHDVERIGRYTVTGHLGEGRLTRVVCAESEGVEGFRRLFALKRLKPDVPDREALGERLEANAREVARLSHGNIVQLLGVTRDGARDPSSEPVSASDHGGVILVLEHVDGWDLRRVLDRARVAARPLPVAYAAWICLQLLRALEVAHGQAGVLGDPSDGLAHGAVHGGNVLVSRAGDVKLADFGLSAQVLAEEGLPAADDAARAQDLSQVAALLHDCLVLAEPGAPRAPVREARPDVPEAFASAIDSALAADRGDDGAARGDLLGFKQAADDALREADVFSPDRLGAWLRDLFGEAALVMDDVSADLPEDADPTMPSPEPVDGLELDEPSDPGDADADERTAANVSDEDDAGATVVHRRGAVPLLLDDPQDATRVRPELSALVQARSVAAAPAGVGWGMVSLVGLAGLIVGLVLALGLQRAGFAQLQPVLDIVPAPGVAATITVNDQPAEGPLSLSAGEPHRVEVTLGSGRAWEFELVLQPNEYRKMYLEVHEIGE